MTIKDDTASQTLENGLIHGNKVGLSGIFTVNCECAILENLKQEFISVCVFMLTHIRFKML